MTQYVIDTKAGKSISAYIILKKGKQVGKILAHFGDSGKVFVNVWDYNAKDDNGFQYGSASGWGYDKFTAALNGLKIDGHLLSDHCASTINPPKCGYFSPDYKAPKGYTLCNSIMIDEQGRKISRVWDDEKGIYLVGEYKTRENLEAGDCETVEPESVHNVYTSCHKKSGFEYLEALGYTVIKVI